MLRFMIGAVFVILSTTVPISAQVPSFQPVTDAMLEDPPPESCGVREMGGGIARSIRLRVKMLTIFGLSGRGQWRQGHNRRLRSFMGA